jgi:N-acyl-D-amino-acid deacylase
MRQILKNAKIYDGTGTAPYTADILVEGERIARIAKEMDLPADQVMDLRGKSVSSGFIDEH